MKYKFPETGNKPVDDLGRQYEKIVKTWNRGSIKTRYRYADAGARFVKWVQPTFRMQKLANLHDKHIIAYGKHLKAEGKSDKYIKNEISALQYLHSYIPHTRYELSDSKELNKAIGLGSTPNHKAKNLDQTWTKKELDRFVEHAQRNGRADLALMAEVTYHTGCRLEEVSTLRRHEVEKALKTGQLDLRNTKGGRPRSVPLSDEAKRLFSEAIRDVPRGNYVFVPEGKTVHGYIQGVKDFIYRHREKFQDPTRVGDPSRTELHWHGLRHSYAENTYRELRGQGYADQEARREVSGRLGHSREQITTVYVK